MCPAKTAEGSLLRALQSPAQHGRVEEAARLPQLQDPEDHRHPLHQMALSWRPSVKVRWVLFSVDPYFEPIESFLDSLSRDHVNMLQSRSQQSISSFFQFQERLLETGWNCFSDLCINRSNDPDRISVFESRITPKFSGKTGQLTYSANACILVTWSVLIGNHLRLG